MENWILLCIHSLVKLISVKGVVQLLLGFFVYFLSYCYSNLNNKKKKKKQSPRHSNAASGLLFTYGSAVSSWPPQPISGCSGHVPYSWHHCSQLESQGYGSVEWLGIPSTWKIPLSHLHEHSLFLSTLWKPVLVMPNWFSCWACYMNALLRLNQPCTSVSWVWFRMEVLACGWKYWMFVFQAVTIFNVCLWSVHAKIMSSIPIHYTAIPLYLHKTTLIC